MPLSIRRAVATLAILIGFFGYLVVLLDRDPDPTSPPVLILVSMEAWMILSFVVKAIMLHDYFLKWVNATAIVMWSIFVLWAYAHPNTSAHVPGNLSLAIFTLWILSWPLIDLVDLCIPRRAWRLPAS